MAIGNSNSIPFKNRKGFSLPCLTNSLFLGKLIDISTYVDKSGLENDIPIIDSNCKQFNGIDSKITIGDAYLGLMNSYSIEYSTDAGVTFQTWTSGDAAIQGLTQRPTIYHVDIGFDGTDYFPGLAGNISFYDSEGVKQVEFTNAEGIGYSINRLDKKNLIHEGVDLTIEGESLYIKI